MEWIGEGEFQVDFSSRDEWVITEAFKLQNNDEKKLKESIKGQGQIFYEKSLKNK